MHWSLVFHGSLSLLLNFLLTFLVLSLSSRQPWRLNKVSIHHMCLCINKQNKQTKKRRKKKDSNLVTVRANPRESNWGILFIRVVFPQNSFTLIRIDKKYNLYPVLITLMKHCLFVSSRCHYFLSFFVLFFLSFFFFLLFKLSQVSVPWRVLFNYQPTKVVWHSHENIYNRIQIHLTASKQEQTV